MTHTTGNWKIWPFHAKDNEIQIYADGTPLIAKVYFRDVSINEQLANAHLISAAPDLLEALETMVKAYEDNSQTYAMMAADLARHAIKKARGENA